MNERAHSIKRMFDEIVKNYDLLNHLMSLGMDYSWRKKTSQRLSSNANSILDLASGTGDLAFEIISRFPDHCVIGLDFSMNMLAKARQKSLLKNMFHSFLPLQGDALSIPFLDNSFDAVTMGFGFRNVTDKSAAIFEIVRVLRPSGKILILDFAYPERWLSKIMIPWYLNTVIPLLGGLISGNYKAYKYLPDSIQSFLRPDEMLDLYEKAGLTHCRMFPMSFGITYLWEGVTGRKE